MTQPNAGERTALYKFYAVDDMLLYVGITKRLGSRWGEHAKVQPWWLQVDHQTVQWLPSRKKALTAEKSAIRAEVPVFNIVGSIRNGWILDEETGFPVPPKPASRPRPQGHDELPSIYHGDGWQWPHERVACQIEKAIASGEYVPGTALPSQNQIAEEAGVSKHTVSAAVRLLCDRGVLYTRPGRGTFISPS